MGTFRWLARRSGLLPIWTVAIATTGATTWAAPAISRHPADVSIIAGQNATFTVVATGTGTLGYQWRRSGFPISGATTNTLVVGRAKRADADLYDVVVSDGSGSVTSDNARLAVAPTAYPTNIVPDAASISNLSPAGQSASPPSHRRRRAGSMSAVSSPASTACAARSSPATAQTIPWIQPSSRGSSDEASAQSLLSLMGRSSSRGSSSRSMGDRDVILRA